MKKKNLRQKREQEKQKRIAMHTSPAETKKDPAENKTAEPEIKSHVLKKGERKSYAKIAGLKSAFVVGDSVYLTSFGKGNKARLDTKVYPDNTTEKLIPETERHTLDVAFATDTDLSLVCSLNDKGNVTADNPTYNRDSTAKSSRNDMLNLKPVLERYYFGREFDDNIHIQIIHNIQELAKIFSAYSNNIVYALDNIIADAGEERSDMIGSMNISRTYEKYEDKYGFFKRFTHTDRTGYFGSAFYVQKGDKFEKRSEWEIYNILALVGSLRQCCFHGKYNKYDSNLSWMYNFWNCCDKTFLDTLDSMFAEMQDKVNSGFLELNKVDTVILSKLYPEKSLNEIVKLLYNFTTIKEYKNIGFSIKRIRENILSFDAAAEYISDKYNTERRKLYKLMDFCIYMLYIEDTERCGNIVQNLRECIVDTDKALVYSSEAKYVWEKLRDNFDVILKNIDGSKYEKMKKSLDLTDVKSEFDKIKLDVNVSYFSKLVYLLTFFLDGKEINDLVTTLINKFDNIASFIDASEQIGMDIVFKKEFAFFNSSSRVVTELNIIRNFARMQRPVPDSKRNMLEDAVRILGGSDEEIADIVYLMTGYDKDGAKLYKNKKGFRNFIINNVVDSSRFRYLVRYANPKKIRRVAGNKNVIDFVLKEIPDAQIEKYFVSCYPDKEMLSFAYARKSLSEMLRNISFNQFADVNQDDRTSTRREKMIKERYKAIIGLYLTVMYLLVKNLVNVNSRYVTAFHCFERDAMHYDVKWYQKDVWCDYRSLTEQLLSEGDNSRSRFLANNMHQRKCIIDDLANSKELVFHINGFTNDALKYFRNNVAHLSAIRNADKYIDDISEVKSYYALYHYLIQRKIMEDCHVNSDNHKYFENLIKYRSYVMDFVKAVCIPFGYNTPRFKNLTIEGKFDRNRKTAD